MITYPADVKALLDAGRTRIRGLIRFDFGGGTYGFIKAMSPLVYNGVTYNPGGIIKVSGLSAGTGMTAQNFTITLAASDDALTPAVLQTIEQEDYRDRPITIMDAHFHPDTGTLLLVQTMKRGYIDTIEHDDSGSDGYTLVANCENRALDYTRTNGRKRSNTDQNRRSPGDNFFQHASATEKESTLWGTQKKNAN